MKSFTMKISKEQKTLIKTLAEERGLTQAAIVRLALFEFIKSKDQSIPNNK